LAKLIKIDANLEKKIEEFEENFEKGKRVFLNPHLWKKVAFEEFVQKETFAFTSEREITWSVKNKPQPNIQQ